MRLNDFWAKNCPKMAVTTHGKIAGIAAQILFDNMLSDGTRQLLSFLMQLELKKLRQFIGYLVSLHDIGKIDYHFQAQDEQQRMKLIVEDLCPGETFARHYRHEKTTEQILWKIIWKEQKCGKRTAKFYAAVLGAHHQGKIGEASPDAELLQDYQREYEQQMRSFFLNNTGIMLPEIQKEDRGSVGAILLGLTVLADWISSSDYFERDDDHMDAFEQYISQKTQRFLDISGLNKANRVFGDAFSEVWPQIPEEGMRPLQKEIEKLFRESQERMALILLEAPMGEGKTEAGCYAAVQMGNQYKKNGIYFALPTSATANQMVCRMRDWLKDNVRLLHGMAWMEESDAIANAVLHIDDKELEETARHWLEPVRRGLLSCYAVGTIDQAMMAAMMVKYGCLRLLGLSGKVLLIDELHAYDMYMGTIVERLLDWCKALEIPVVLLSATLPPDKKQQMLRPYTKELLGKEYPAITAVTQSGKLLVRPITEITRRQTVTVKLLPILHHPDRIALQAVRMTENGGCLCVLLNTVKQAQEVYKAIKNTGFDGTALLFHARFPAERRNEIEQECVKFFGKDKNNRPEKAILVATQVVEQSLDVDFDFFMTSVVPVDLLLQRSGREFRHEETKRPAGIKLPVFCVMIPEGGEQAEDTAFAEDGYVYPICLLRQSIHLLQNRQSIRIPEDMAQLVADGYDEEKAPAEYVQSWWETTIGNQIQAGQSELYCLSHPKERFDPIQKLDTFAFDDAETDSYFSAKTRLGEPTIRIALVDDELYEVIQKQIMGKKHIPQKIAKKVLRRSVPIIRKQVTDVLTNSTQVLVGTGLLLGVAILPSVNDIFEENGVRITFDDTLGVLIEKK